MSYMEVLMSKQQILMIATSAYADKGCGEGGYPASDTTLSRTAPPLHAACVQGCFHVR